MNSERKKILIAATNPWSFSLAVERQIAREHQHDQVDVLNLFRLSDSLLHARPIDRLAELLNRKIERFLLPVASGADITDDVGRQMNDSIPPLPSSPQELRNYSVGEARIGLAVLSSVTSFTTVQNPDCLSEYGPALPRAWRSAHLSEQAARVVSRMGYAAAYIFNGRHSAARPFCDVLQERMTVYRYEQGGTGNRYIMSARSIHEPREIARLIEEHDFDREAGEEFFENRLRKAPGNPAEFFTIGQVSDLLPEGVEPGRAVSFFTSSSDERHAISDKVEYGSFCSQYQAALAIARICAASNYQLVVRFHPHLQFKHPSWRKEWDIGELRRQGAILVDAADPVDTYALVRASRCVLTCGSTVGLEATYLGIPAAEIGELPAGILGATNIARDEAGLKAFIERPMMPPDAREKAIRYGSYACRAGKLLPELDVATHPYYARIAGRIVDPVRYVFERLRSRVRPKARIALPPGGKLVVEPSVIERLAERQSG